MGIIIKNGVEYGGSGGMGLIIKNGVEYGGSGGGGGTGVTVTVTTETEEFYGKLVTLTDGIDTMTAVFSNEGVAVFEGVKMEGELTVSLTVAGDDYSNKISVQSHYSVDLNKNKIFGVSWNDITKSKLLRTDGAVNFVDPVVGMGTTEGSSPFDNIYPWSEMIIVEHPLAGTCVKIPKFYLKLIVDDNNIVIGVQISKNKLPGFIICPACMDRGDGHGERDYILIGRYLCDSEYKSRADKDVLVNKTVSDFRSGIRNLGDTIYQFDYAAWFTLQILYLVEYADWESQKVIGLGQGSAVTRTGSTDNMNYHTGTTANNLLDRSNVQYRNIEDIWSNRRFWVDGMMVEANSGGTGKYGILIAEDLSKYDSNDVNDYIKMCYGPSNPEDGWIAKFSAGQGTGYEWFFWPSELTALEDDSHVKDKYSWAMYSMPTGTRWMAGAHTETGNTHEAGMFIRIGANGSSSSYGNVGGRLMVLP